MPHTAVLLRPGVVHYDKRVPPTSHKSPSRIADELTISNMPKMTIFAIRRLHGRGVSMSRLADMFNCKRTVVRILVKELGV